MLRTEVVKINLILSLSMNLVMPFMARNNEKQKPTRQLVFQSQKLALLCRIISIYKSIFK